MHLLFADSVADLTIAELSSRGHRCFVEPALTTAELPARIAGVDGLVVRSTKVDRAVFEAADKLALVIRAGAGTNTIDVEAAARNGVLVSNVPGRNAVAVAELTMGLILALDRRIADNVADARQGRWDEGDLQQGQRAARQHPRDPRHGLDRPCRGRAGGRVRDADRLPGPPRPQPSHLRPAGRARRRGFRLAARAARRVRRGEPAPTVVAGDQEPRGRRLPGRDEARRDPRQHLARRRGRRGGAARGARRRPRPRRPRRVRRRAGLGRGRVGLPARQAPSGGGHPPHRRLHRAGPGRHRRGGRGDRRRVRGGRGAQLRQPRTARAGQRHSDRAPPRQGRRAGQGAGAAAARPGSTSSTCRTGSSRAARRRSPRSTSRAPCPPDLPAHLEAIPEVLGSSLVALDSTARDRA